MKHIIPKYKMRGSTTEVLKEGYRYIPNHMKKLGTDIFQTRLLGQKSIVMTGLKAMERTVEVLL
ncbi:hypothetical protein [Metaplanococcus flavidus]|uniref:Uncharacterized protein n=1 Tax=Metaplanococcus flavidus TaxID=569883 RepID=A0ABW3LG51_9BACL